MMARVTELVFLFMITDVLAGGGGGKHHVHFKIHVPDIIKHHIHTKTVFIHVHHGGGGGGGGGKKKAPPKKKETHHEESHHEDWSSWSSFDVHDGHGEGKDHKHHGTKNVKNAGGGHPAHLTFGTPSQGYGSHDQGYDPRARPHGMLIYPGGEHQMQVQDSHSDFIGGGGHPVPPPEEGSQNAQNYGSNNKYQHQDGGLVGYSYPPQYQVTEAVHNDIEPYNDAFEEGYRKGHHSVTGHLLSENMKNFYDNKFEEGDASNDGYNSDSYDKYKDFESLKDEHSGSSSDVDDEEYNRRRSRGYRLPYRRVG